MSEETTPVSPPRSHRPPGRLTSAEMSVAELAKEKKELEDRLDDLEDRSNPDVAITPHTAARLEEARLEARNKLWDKLLNKSVLWPTVGALVLIVGFVVAGVTGHLPVLFDFLLDAAGLLPGVDAPAD